jgi:hypothetical protein
MLPEQPGRYVRQGLVGLYWWSLLPKTGKIVTLGDDAFVSCTGPEPISLCNFCSQSNEASIFSAWFFLSFAY